MNWISDKEKLDGGRFRCPSCRSTLNLRANSIFQGCKLPIPTLYWIILEAYLK